MEVFKDISADVKFAIMLVIYTGYMTWWASGISHDVTAIQHTLEEHVHTGDHPRYQTQAIKGILETQGIQTQILTNLNTDHVRCKVLLETLTRRLTRLEELEAEAHKRGNYHNGNTK